MAAGRPRDFGLHTATLTTEDLGTEGGTMDELLEFFTESITQDGSSSVVGVLKRLSRQLRDFKYRVHFDSKTNVLSGRYIVCS